MDVLPSGGLTSRTIENFFVVGRLLLQWHEDVVHPTRQAQEGLLVEAFLPFFVGEAGFVD